MTNKNNKDCGCNDGHCLPSSDEISKNNEQKEILPEVTRKDFLKFLGVSPLAGYAAFSQTKNQGERYNSIPVNKKLSPEWIQSLYKRGKPNVYRDKKDLPYIGMPVGGFCTGTIYLGGDGKHLELGYF